MDLDKPLIPERLYHAVGGSADSNRPVFTGDIYQNIDIPGIGQPLSEAKELSAMIVAHPCSIRGRSGSLKDQIQVAPVVSHPKQPDDKWATGYYNRMPLYGLPLQGAFHVVYLDLLSLASTDAIRKSPRIACLTHPGINQLQQRLVFHLTRHPVPVRIFQAAFAHTYEEADRLEDWVTELEHFEASPEASFEAWIRAGEPSRQTRLQTPAERALIRQEMRAELKARLISHRRGGSDEMHGRRPRG